LFYSTKLKKWFYNRMGNNIVPRNEGGVREKRLVASSSVIAAIFLTAAKLIVGLLTQSLGILSEAAHSGLDLMAAGITYYSVRVSGRPPDEAHHYGHGKIENLSALAETLLLFITCAWIVYEAIRRLSSPFPIEVTIWSFLVMAVSIIIDITRSRALIKTAKKYSSQALEADALHFSTDVWSSSVVILGLIAVYVSRLFVSSSPILASWLSRADAIAALGVSAIILLVSYRLGSKTIGVLLDTAPKGIAKQVKEAAMRLPGVSAVQRVRVRQSGAATFVDITLEVPNTKSFEESHEIAQQAEVAIRNVAPACDVMVHVEPVCADNESLLERVRSVARKQGMNIHDMCLNDVYGQSILEVHAEVPEDITVSEAHNCVTALEDALLHAFPELTDIVVHIDPVGETSLRRPSELSMSGIHDKITEIVKHMPDIQNCHSITVLRERNHLVTSFHCTVSPNFPITQAHELTDQIENLLRERLPLLERVTIHLEPCDGVCQVCHITCHHKLLKS
jgi:cation diffusion facilitator family transporter